MSHFTYMQKQLTRNEDPLIVLTIELDNNKFAQLNIFEDSDPEVLSTHFVVQHKLAQAYIGPLKQNIIQQMLLYDKIKQEQQQQNGNKKVNQNKENQLQAPKTTDVSSKMLTPQKKRIWDEFKPKEPIKSPLKHKVFSGNKTQENDDTDIEHEVYEKLYQQSKALKQKRQTQHESNLKQKEQAVIKDPNLTFAPKINKASRDLVQRMKTNREAKNFNSSPFLRKNKTPPKQSPIKCKQFKMLPSHFFSFKEQFKPKSPRLNNLYSKQNKSFEFQKPDYKVSILDPPSSSSYAQSSNQSIQEVKLPKGQKKFQPIEEMAESPNISFSEKNQFQNQGFSSSQDKLGSNEKTNKYYTNDQIENSFSELLIKEFVVSDPNEHQVEKILIQLFNLLDVNEEGLADPHIIPYERLSSQLIVHLRMHFQKIGYAPMDYNRFQRSAKNNNQLIKVAFNYHNININKSAADFFGIKFKQI